MPIFTIASISDSLSDPAGTSPLVAAVQWLEGTVLGTIALTVAILAVASVGFMMLTGRVNLRHGATVIMGCFILFGAPGIVAGMQSAMRGADVSEQLAAVPEPPPVVIPAQARAPSDPYAGASLRPR
jgi:type IV secretory pathway VirB2 component (pilin)